MSVYAFIFLSFAFIIGVTFYFMRKWVMEYGNNKPLPGEITLIIIAAAIQMPVALVKLVSFILSFVPYLI